ncbi:MAG: hypothetical protein GWN37_14415, partial [Gammaproteobacteria bacterium]|nr:hypothetical protein [Gammaproteobacteria bacterium]
EQGLEEAQGTLCEDERRVAELGQSLEELEPAWQQAREAEQASAAELARAEESMHDWQIDWDEF